MARGIGVARRPTVTKALSGPSVEGVTRREESRAGAVVWFHVIGMVLFLLGVLGSQVTDTNIVLDWLGDGANLPVGNSLFPLVVMGALVWALQRRKRIGLWAAVFFQVSGGVVNALYTVFSFTSDVSDTSEELEPGIEQAFTPDLALMHWCGMVVSILMVTLMLRCKRAFPGRLRQGSWSAILTTLILGFAFTLLTLVVLILAQGGPEKNAWGSVPGLFLGAIGAAPPALWAKVPPEVQWLSTPLSFMLVVVVVVVLYVMLSFTADANQWTARREVALRKLLLQNGEKDSLAYYATRRDKQLAFNDSESAAVDYRVVGSVSLASGDPIGPPSKWPEAIAAWKAEARYYGWTLAALGASEDGARAYRDVGLSVLSLGDEAVVDVDSFTMNSTSRTSMRRAVNKLRKAGYTIRIRRQEDIETAEQEALVSDSGRWRHGGVERGFSMALGRIGDPADRGNIVVTAHDENGARVGLLTFVPWGKRGASLDLMRRSPDAPNGLTEFMVVSMIESASDVGVARVSLNFAMFRGLFASAEKFAPSLPVVVATRVLSFFDRFFQLESLYAFSTRFSPRWVQRYLCYESALSLTKIALAAGVAEGFIPLPLWRGSKEDARSLGTAELEELSAYADVLEEKSLNVQVRRSDQTKRRIEKVLRAQETGVDLYPIGLPHATALSAVSTNEESLRCYGRVKHRRKHGGVVFLELTESGTSHQVVVEKSAVSEESMEACRKYLSLGDIVVVEGQWGKSRSGSVSIIAASVQIAAKSLLPIPFREFNDPERRSRERSLDLIVNTDGAQMLRARSAAVLAARVVLHERGLMEVETPILNTIHGGASARPFRTYINAYSQDLTLRIAPELFLKRLVVAGMGGVFEVGRNFRNEGADATHNPEFTAIEVYEPFSDYDRMRELMQHIVQEAAKAVHGEMAVPLPSGPGGSIVMTDISGTWPVKTVTESVSEAVGERVGLDTDMDRLLEICRDHGVPVRDEMGQGALIEELYGEIVEPATVRPTFYVDFPVETSPLAGKHPDKPGYAQRWDLVAAGTEIGTAYSELTDPLDQRDRFTAQSLKAAAGDLEAMELDEDFLRALELGMPPCGGLGFGVDRLVMLLTGTNIKSVLAFPFVKPSS